MADSAIMKNGSKKKGLGCLIAAACGILCIGLLCFACRFRHFTSPEAFTAAGYKLPFPVPEHAADIRLAGRKILLGQQHLCAFTLPEAESAEYIAALVSEYHLDTENAPDSVSAHWYGRMVPDCAAEDAEGSPLKSEASFRQVTDRNLADAKVIFYEPYQTGSRSSGILMFPDTCEFITFLYLSR